MGKQKMTMGFGKLMMAAQHLRTMRQCPEYSITDRTILRALVDKVDDAVRPFSTNLSRINETFSEVKAHKEFAESLKTAKKIIEETQDLKDTVMLGQTELEFEPIVLKIPSGACEAKYLEIYLEYEGLFW